MRIICFGTLANTIVIYFTLPTRNFLLFNANIATLGFFILPVIPVGYSFSIELTYPVSEVMSNGIIILFA